MKKFFVCLQIPLYAGLFSVSSGLPALEIKQTLAGLEAIESDLPPASPAVDLPFDRDLSLEIREFDRFELSAKPDNQFETKTRFVGKTPDYLDKSLTDQKVITSQIGQDSTLSPEELIDFEDQLAIEALESDWANFRQSIKGSKNKVESSLGFSVSSLNSAFESDRFERAPAAGPGYPDSNTNKEFGEGRGIPTYYKILHTILNARQEYPLTFYSVIFFLAFFVIIKSILIAAMRLR